MPEKSKNVEISALAELVMLRRYFSLFEGERARASVQKREMVVSTAAIPEPHLSGKNEEKTMKELGEEFLPEDPEEWGYMEGDIPSSFFMPSASYWLTAPMCPAQSLSVVSCRRAGLSGLPKEDNKSSTELPGEGE